jgi:hypothetical protein
MSTPLREPRNLTARNWVSFFRRPPRPFRCSDFKSASKADAGCRTSVVRRPLNTKRSLEPLASPRKCASFVADHPASSAATISEMPKKPLPLFFK